MICRKKIKNYMRLFLRLIEVLVFVSIIVVPFFYWILNPSLTKMEVFLDLKYFFLVIILYVICRFYR